MSWQRFLAADFYNKGYLIHERKPHNFTLPLALLYQEREKEHSPSPSRRRGEGMRSEMATFDRFVSGANYGVLVQARMNFCCNIIKTR